MKNAENSSDFAFVLISGPPNRRLDDNGDATGVILGPIKSPLVIVVIVEFPDEGTCELPRGNISFRFVSRSIRGIACF